MENYTENEYALCSRLKSKKKKKRLVKEDFEKKLRQHFKQRKLLFNAFRDLPLVSLDEPYQKGWFRFFVLRSDVLIDPNAGFFINLLEKINTYQFSNEKSFNKTKRKFRKKISVPSKQFLKQISIYDWNSKKINLTENEKSYFTLTKRWSSVFERDISYYTFNEPWRFVLCVKPYMIAHKKSVDSDLESELRVLENYILNHHLNHKINRLVLGYSRPSWYCQTENPKEKNPIKNKSLEVLYQQYLDEMI
ncbi:hypothetical protein Flavo103_30340 [Flavobacterium collinsii]|uniref:hypothetical protein n=1 Tax=Flavobacterium collinsii TaxID=1114861 RepID=UPI0022CB784D|nr:hypothetical protein [Flavobacterium collinsii]GIQ59898.1 hypothetical protein Flavo103_30340 [Flavobacterium collinsii]